MSFLEEFPQLRIPYEDIVLATRCYDSTAMIGDGASGNVYSGVLYRSGTPISVAIKRLATLTLVGHGRKEFLAELELLARCRHPNIISLVGYCEEHHIKLVIYELAEGRSLDNYLNRVCPLTWNQRIKICIDVARGLDYCHNHLQENHKIIHRDIKSANILLDRNLKAMIGDFGLSVTGRSNKNNARRTVSGTPGYWDPAYIKTGILTCKSDVYSFGVVLFEVLCGRLCFKNVIGEQRDLVPLARRRYEEGRLNEIMDLDLKDSDSVKEFSKLAYQCLEDDPEGRPSVDLVLQKLEKVLQLYELDEALESQAILKTVEICEQGDQVSELQDFRILPTSLKSQAFGVHNDQQLFNQLPSRGSMRPGQRSLINQLQYRNAHRGSDQRDGFVDDEKLLSLTDFCYRNGISNNQDRNIITKYDVDGQPISVGVVAQDMFSYPSVVIGDPYAGDKAFTLSDLARPQPSQTRGSLTNKENDDEN